MNSSGRRTAGWRLLTKAAFALAAAAAPLPDWLPLDSGRDLVDYSRRDLIGGVASFDDPGNTRPIPGGHANLDQ